MPASPVPVLFTGPSLVQLAQQFGATIIALLDEVSGTSFKEYSGKNGTITGPATHITYRNPSLARGVARSVGYDGAQTADIVGPVVSSGSFTAVQFFRVVTGVSVSGNFPGLISTNGVSFFNQGLNVFLDCSSAAPWKPYFQVGYAGTPQAGNTLFTEISASGTPVGVDKSYAVVATYNSSGNAMALYLRGIGAAAATLLASGTAGGTATAAPNGIAFGDSFPYSSSVNFGWTGPGLYFPRVLSMDNINALTGFIQ